MAADSNRFGSVNGSIALMSVGCVELGPTSALHYAVEKRALMQRPNSSRGREKVFREERKKGLPLDGKGKADSQKPKVPGARGRYLRAYGRWLYPYRFALIGVFLLALTTAALDMVWPLAIKHIIDAVLLGKNLSYAEKSRALAVFGAAVVVLLILKQAVDSTRSFRGDVLDAKVTIRLRRRMFERLLGLSIPSLADLKSGGIVSRLSADIDAVAGLVEKALISPGIAAIRIVLTLSILMWLSWRPGLAGVFLIPTLGVIRVLW